MADFKLMENGVQIPITPSTIQGFHQVFDKMELMGIQLNDEPSVHPMLQQVAEYLNDCYQLNAHGYGVKCTYCKDKGFVYVCNADCGYCHREQDRTACLCQKAGA